MTKQQAQLLAQRTFLDEAAKFTSGSVGGGQSLHRDLEDTVGRLELGLSTQKQALVIQKEDVTQQLLRLQDLADLQRAGRDSLAAAVDRGPRQILEAVSTLRAQANGLLEETWPVQANGSESQRLVLRSALEGHAKAQDSLISSLKNTTIELQVLKLSHRCSRKRASDLQQRLICLCRPWFAHNRPN